MYDTTYDSDQSESYNHFNPLKSFVLWKLVLQTHGDPYPFTQVIAKKLGNCYFGPKINPRLWISCYSMETKKKLVFFLFSLLFLHSSYPKN